MYYELHKDVRSISFADYDMPNLPIVTIMPVTIDPEKKFHSLADVPQHRIDLVDEATAERVALWLRFSDFTFDATKHDFEGMFRLCIRWIDKLLEMYKKKGREYILIEESNAGGPLRYGADRNDPKQNAARELWSAILRACQPGGVNQFGGEHVEGASLYSRIENNEHYYELTLHAGQGVKFYLTKAGKMGNFFMSNNGFMGVPDAEEGIVAHGTTWIHGQAHDFMFSHPLLGQQLLDRVSKNALTQLYTAKLKEHLPFLFQNRQNNDFELDWNDNMKPSPLRVARQQYPMAYNPGKGARW